MSNGKKQGLSAEPTTGEPKAREPKGKGSPPIGTSESKNIGLMLIGPKLRGFFASLLDSVVVMDAVKLFVWIGSILLIAGACWILTQPVRDRYLMRAVNRVLEQYGDSRRLSELASGGGGASIIGSWYIMIKGRQQGISGTDNFVEGTRAFIFTFIAEGAFFPCAAIIDPVGQVKEFIPLNIHGKKILDRISPGILKLYIKRIEGSLL
jgi:hypothetical protein